MKNPSRRPAVSFSQLLAAVPEATLVRGGDTPITGMAYDSRQVVPGALFAAVPGLTTDGHRFVGAAAASGAVAVVVQADRLEDGTVALDSIPPNVAVAVVPDTRRALALLAAAYYDYPARKLRVFGVTGTDGKTTTCYLIAALLEAAGRKVAMVTTVGYKIGDREWPNETRQTTPESLDIQAFLAEAVEAGANEAVIETSSHALALDRVVGCEFVVAVITNVTGDHLDFHQTFERYLQDKARLFRMLGETVNREARTAAVINLDDERSAPTMQAAAEEVGPRLPYGVLTYGIDTPAQVMARDLRLTASGAEFRITTPWGTVDADTPLPARYNVSNTLAAVAAVMSQGATRDELRRGLMYFKGVPGRMERIAAGQPFTVIVDYAHTPEGFRKTLEALKPLTSGRVIVVFGCAGERDRERRVGMGRVAAELTDFAVLTNEDPRSEDADAIIEEIASTMRGAGAPEGDRFVRVSDRTKAIRTVFERAVPGDLVLLAGKGHEQSMIVGDQKLPWDDRKVARAQLLEISQNA